MTASAVTVEARQAALARERIASGERGSTVEPVLGMCSAAGHVKGAGMSTQTDTGIDTRLFLGGEFVEADGGRTFENRDPFTGEVASEVAAGTRADVQRGSHPFPF